ncbi:MAG: carbohydrate kinase family protein [Desulfohalobiaceae bacterium]|nr:carbohydrate kinase family protein [Desulfohalobiaceae bacterium]
MSIYISGSLAYDRIMNFPDKFANHILPDKLHILNVCFLVNELKEKFGGTAGNIAYSLALLGERPTVLASVGSDFDRYEKWFRELDIGLEGVKKVQDVHSASAYITTDQADNQITAFHPGAMDIPTSGDFTSFETKDSLAIVSPGNLEDMQSYPRKYKQAGIPYIFDPGQNIPAFSGQQLEEMITGSEILIANDYELSLIMQATGLHKDELLKRTNALVTTLGEEGSIIEQSDRETIRVPAARAAEVKDPTGAGDAFRAGLIKGQVQGEGLENSAKIGANCASFCVEHVGTQDHSFDQQEFWQRYRANFG